MPRSYLAFETTAFTTRFYKAAEDKMKIATMAFGTKIRIDH
jgi:hypothetical protein